MSVPSLQSLKGDLGLRYLPSPSLRSTSALDWTVITFRRYQLSECLTFRAALWIQVRNCRRFQAWHWPGSPFICVDVERIYGSLKLRRGFKEPHLHVSTGIPLMLSVYYAIIAQSRKYTYALLQHHKTQELNLHCPSYIIHVLLHNRACTHATYRYQPTGNIFV